MTKRERQRQLQLLKNNHTVFMRRAFDHAWSRAEQADALAQANATKKEIEALEAGESVE